MKLYIKQKVFSIGAKFSVKDEAGNDRYFVEGEILTLGRNLHIYDINNNEVAFVLQKIFNFINNFKFYLLNSHLYYKMFTLTGLNANPLSIIPLM